MANKYPPDIGYVFRDEKLLQTALTHASVQKSGANNERLEFLGDRVLGLVIANLLYDVYPQEKEGALAKRLTAHVQQSALVRVAEKIGLSDVIAVSAGEKRSGGAHKEAILADAVEALIGAIYLDGGLDAARDFIKRFWADMQDAQQAPPEDPKTALQEWAQARSLGLPVYETLAREGAAHAPMFTVALNVPGFDRLQASGTTKRAAEKEAARLMLQKIEKATS